MNKININRKNKLIFFIIIFLSLLTKICLSESPQNRPFMQPLTINNNNTKGISINETLKAQEISISNILLPNPSPIQTSIIPIYPTIWAPIQLPIQPPIQIPTQIPIQLPMQLPIQPPLQPPMQTPMQTPIQLPMQTSMQLPMQTSMQLPMQTSMQLPVQTSMQIPLQPQMQPPPMINLITIGNIMNRPKISGELPIETVMATKIVSPMGMYNYETPIFFNHFLEKTIINPMIKNPVAPLPIMTNQIMMNPVSTYPIMTNQIIKNNRFYNPMMINGMQGNTMAGRTQPMIMHPMYNQVNQANEIDLMFNVSDFPQLNNTLFQNVHFPEPINLLYSKELAENENVYIFPKRVMFDMYPQDMLVLLEKSLDIPDKIILNKKGRKGRIESYTIYGSNAIFEIIVPATFIDYDYVGIRRHFYDPKTGKTITAINSKLGFTVNGIPPDFNLDPYPVPDYAWWYGCAPTSAGMAMGYYDWNGYPNMIGTNLSEAELISFTSLLNPANFNSDYYLINDYLINPLASNPPLPTLLCNQNIASAGHITDFWSAPGSLIDPLPTGIPHVFDCLADFMGTSQLNIGTYFDPVTGTTQNISNTDGSTSFWWYDDGAPFTDVSIASNLDIINASGLCGMVEYAQFRGYTASGFNQRPDTWIAINDPTSPNLGFTFLDFKNEILAGRPVLILLANGSYAHTVLAFGYNEDLTVTPPLQQILLRDTWKPATIDFHTMSWGGTYPNPIDPAYPYECTLVISFTITSVPIL